jgi:SAM-dependent methyltransferase
VADYAAEVVSIDLSAAVEVAQENCGYRANVHVVQASITQLPFRLHTFDFVFSIGVLHHTPNPKASFLALTRVLRSGGEIAIWVYAAHQWLSFFESDFLRRYTTRMPQRLLYYLCYLSIPLYWLYQLPIVGLVFKYFLPAISNQPKPQWRVLDTFDWYAPRYQFKYTYPEIYAWFHEAGIDSVVLGSVPIGMRGTLARPASVVEPAVAQATR